MTRRMTSRRRAKVAFDFSNPLSSAASANQDIPEGTMLVGEIHLPDKSFSTFSGQQYLVQDKFSPLVKFWFDFVVKAPVEYAGRTLSGSKPVCVSLQKMLGVAEYPGMAEDCARGDRAVRAILAFDAMARGVPAELSLSDYAELEGRLAAVKMGSWQGRVCMQAFFDPCRAKDKPTCAMLLSVYQQSQQQLAAQQAQSDATYQRVQQQAQAYRQGPTPVPSARVVPQMTQAMPQAMPMQQQMPQQQMPPQQMQPQQMPPQQARNGWPQPAMSPYAQAMQSDDADEDIPF